MFIFCLAKLNAPVPEMLWAKSNCILAAACGEAQKIHR